MEDPKGPELSRSGRDPEPAQFSTLTFEERALFDDLFRALDSVVLERSAEGHAFRAIHEVPEWANNLIIMASDQSTPDLWVVRSHFLTDYVSRATSWWDQHEGGSSDSIPWEEDGPAESSLDLEATAIAIGKQKLLVIKRCAPSRRAYIQLMREKKLDLHPRPSEACSKEAIYTGDVPP